MKDPVCGMDVTDGAWSAHHGAKGYRFCSAGCREVFLADPERYLSGPAEQEFQLVIVGGGPAGITAAVYASQQRLRALLLTPELGGQAADSTKIKNYMGFDLITGPELVQRFRDQLLHSHYLMHSLEEVLRINRTDDGFTLETREGGHYRAASTIVATGMHRRKLGVPGEQRLLRKGVSHRHAQELGNVAGRPAAVIGGGNSGMQAALDLASAGCPVTLVASGALTGDSAEVEKVERNRAIQILDEHEVVTIEGVETVEAVTVRPRTGGRISRREVEAVFIEIGFHPNTDCVAHLVRLNRYGEIETGRRGETDVPGLFAAGDVADNGGKRIIIAAGDGARTALAAGAFLKKV